jgi:hypothetical protein
MFDDLLSKLGNISFSDILSHTIPAALGAAGTYYTSQAANQAALDNLNRQQAFTTSRDQQAFQNAMAMEQLKAALDAGPKAMVKAAKIKAQVDRETNARNAYEALITALLRGGEMGAQAANNLGQNITSIR